MISIHLQKRLLVTLIAAFAGTALAAPLAYVPNEKSGTVSVIDTVTDLRLNDFTVGQRPRGIATGDGRLYLTDGKTGSPYQSANLRRV
jgi:YVTN family beta-propeller protein